MKTKVWTAFESGQITDLKAGQYVSLRLGDDHRTVNEIHVQGQLRTAAIKSVAASGKLTVVEEDDDEDGGGKLMEVDLAPDAIVRIGDLPATRGDLKPGMEVPLEFGRGGKWVNAIEADAMEHSVIEGELRQMNAHSNTIYVELEGVDEGKPSVKPISTTPETIIWLDSKPAKLVDLRLGCWIRLRLSDDGNAVRAIRATSPEPDEDEDEVEEREADDDA